MAVDLSGLRGKIRRYGEGVAAIAARKVEQDTQAAAPVRTGGLRSQIAAGPPVPAGDVLWVRIRSAAAYSSYVDEGTGPHPIEGNPLLVFFWPKVGEVVFFRHVNHPGTTAREFFAEPMPARWAAALQMAKSRVNV